MEFEKKIAVLGSTGSIGTQTLEIAREYKGIKIEAMSAHSNIDLIEKQAREFNPKTVCITDEEKAKDLKIKLADTDIKVVQGKEGLIETATADGADTVVTAVVIVLGTPLEFATSWHVDDTIVIAIQAFYLRNSFPTLPWSLDRTSNQEEVICELSVRSLVGSLDRTQGNDI